MMLFFALSTTSCVSQQHVAIDTSMELAEAEEDIVIDRKRTQKPLQSTRKEVAVR